MIHFNKKLYTDEACSVNLEHIKNSIVSGKTDPFTYCIVISTNPLNLLEIINALEFKFPHYDRLKLEVVGIAGSKKSAVSLVSDIVTDTYRETGSYDIRGYFS